MAFERTPNGSPLEPATVAELRTAFARSLENGDHPDELKSLLIRAAAEARHKGLQAEQLLLVLKDLWYSVAQITYPPDEVQTRLLQQLIARCIQAYYAG